MMSDENIPSSNEQLPIWEQVLEVAKINKEDLKPWLGEVMFTGADSQADWLIMEVGPEQLEQLESGGELFLKGEEEETAVVCSDSETFEVKEAQTSNLLLLGEVAAAKPGAGYFATRAPVRIRQALHTHLELKPCQPRLAKLRRLMQPGPAARADGDAARGWPLSLLLEQVQASRAQIADGLQQMGAFERHGCWRVLDTSVQAQALSQLLLAVEERGLDKDAIDVARATRLLGDDLDAAAVRQVLRNVGQLRTERDSAGELHEVCSLDERAVCRTFGQVLLKHAEGKFALPDFLAAWQDSVAAYGYRTALSQLDGLAVVDTSRQPNVIWYLDETGLPEDLPERFSYLFHVKPKWTHAEIEPFLVPLATSRLSVDAMLAKYCRCSTDRSGVRVYNSKNNVASR